jgi:hypothetical protein
LQTRTEPAQVVTFPREEFLTERWDYNLGEHVTFLAPTQWGKTTLAYELLQVTAHKEVPAVVLVMKPRDRTVDNWAAKLDYRIVKTWPPNQFKEKKEGYVLWPKHQYDPEKDDPKLYREFRRAILDCYKRGNRILFADETYGLTAELKLTKELITVWTRGASMGCGLWAATQKPSHIPLQAYSQAEHIFFGNDPDARARIRFSEIGGIDPDFIYYHVSQLNKYEWLYVRRTGPVACIVSA